jgi:hypothetical protein
MFIVEGKAKKEPGNPAPFGDFATLRKAGLRPEKQDSTSFRKAS